MSTKQSVIESAFAKAAILPEEEGLEDNELIRMLGVMNNLVEVWYYDGIVIPYLISDYLSDDTNLSRMEEEALANSLSIDVMTIYAADRQPSPQLLAKAKNSKRALRNNSAGNVRKTFPSTLPRGAGNTRRSFNTSRTFYNNRQPWRVVLDNREPMFDNDGTPLYLSPNSFRSA